MRLTAMSVEYPFLFVQRMSLRLFAQNKARYESGLAAPDLAPAGPE